MPASAPAGRADSLREEPAADKRKDGGAGEEPGVRTQFADTAFWTPAVVTDAEGQAAVEVTWPDNLTRWRAAAVGSGLQAQVGSGETSVTTRKDILVRLQTPRFLVDRDRAVLTANVHNYTEKPQRVKLRFTLSGETAELYPVHARSREDLLASEQVLEIAPQGERAVDFPVRLVRDGSLRVRVTAQCPAGSDGTETTVPVLVHGVERMLAQGGVMRDEKQVRLAIDLPKERRPGSSELVVQLNPSLGAVMLDALPYLADYPYGCIEQTVSRFVPAVVVAKTLKDLGYSLEALRERAHQLEEKEREGDRAHAGGKTVENSPYTYPQGRPGTMRTEALASGIRRYHSPVWETGQLQSMVLEGLGRIARFQHPDGGWGWWQGDSSDPYMTAYVLYGLQTAAAAGQRVDPGMLERGLAYLTLRVKEDDNPHLRAYEARVLAMDQGRRGVVKPIVNGKLFEQRERLSVMNKAHLATALHLAGEKEKAELVLRNLETTAQVDEANGTASWDPFDRWWWRWWNNKVETNAAVLQAYVAIRPGDSLPPMLVKWLVNNRRANIWSSTRETAMAVYALADWVRASKELAPDYRLTVALSDRVRRTYTVNAGNALFFDNQFVVPDELLTTGAQSLTLTKDGPGALYYTAYTRYFSLEEPIQGTGNEVFVRRRYFRVVPGSASGEAAYKPVDEKRPNPFLTGRYELLAEGGEWAGYRDPRQGPRFERTALKSGDTVTSGDTIEVELQLESKNDYEYLVFEDLKPAGCEPVELRSGGYGGQGLWSNMELRDQKVAFFLTHLPQGKRTITYRLRAETPGQFHVLPTNGYAMYAPDIRCLSDEMGLSVNERAE